MQKTVHELKISQKVNYSALKKLMGTAVDDTDTAVESNVSSCSYKDGKSDADW
jgi:hypothetical protein